MRTMRLQEIAHILNLRLSSSIPIHGYATDSRLIKPGDLFFALKGERSDGHAHLKEAKTRGCQAAVVAASFQGENEGLELLVVEDPLNALQELARHLIQQLSPRVVAITGSVGKTTTKEFTRTLLSTRYAVMNTPGNANSQVGLPLAILNHMKNEEICVLEMGMTQSGQLTQLMTMAPPEVAVLTAIGLVHACNFQSLEEIARAKSEIFLHPHTKVGILNRENLFYASLATTGSCQKTTFSLGKDPADYVWNQDKQTLASTRENKDIFFRNISIPGKHNIQNLLAAIAVARYFEIEWKMIQDAVTALQLPEKRLQFIMHKGIQFINDAYNASEISVKAALESLPQPIHQGRKIAVLGSMLELGDFSIGCHQRVAEFALDQVQELYCLGEECLPMCEVWKNAARPVHYFDHRTELVAYLRDNLQPQDVVLLKGSRSKELWKIVDEI